MDKTVITMGVDECANTRSSEVVRREFEVDKR